MLSHWAEAFPYRRAHCTVGRQMNTRVSPISGVPIEIQNYRGTHFIGQTVKKICKIGLIMKHFHCTFHPQASRLVESTNGTIKNQLEKINKY